MTAHRKFVDTIRIKHRTRTAQGNTEHLTLLKCFTGLCGVFEIISGVFFALFSPESRHTPLLAQKQGIVFIPKIGGIAVFSPIGGLLHHQRGFTLNRRFKGKEKTH